MKIELVEQGSLAVADRWYPAKEESVIVRHNVGDDYYYIGLWIHARKCQFCQAYIIDKGIYQGLGYSDIKLTLKSNIRCKHPHEEFDICVPCYNSGAITMECYACKETVSSDNIQEKVGAYQSHYLCKKCYETLSAKKWDELSEELYDIHRYDSY